MRSRADRRHVDEADSARDPDENVAEDTRRRAAEDEFDLDNDDVYQRQHAARDEDELSFGL